MNRQDSHSYAYDGQAAYYPSATQPSSDYPVAYHYDSPGYYPPNSSGHTSQAAAHGPYIRSTTPALSQGHRYNSGSGRDARYYTSQAVASSSADQQAYPAEVQYYHSQHAPSASPVHRSRSPGRPGFIPTPTEMTAQSYSGYGSMPHSPTVTQEHYSSREYSSRNSEYPSPSHIVPSSHLPSQHRPARIVTARTSMGSSSTSPTSSSSPSGERFPCEKCGKTFSRSHDRKRHHETQHLPSPVIHRCRYCEKEFSRADSLKRHLDNGCDEMP